MKTAAWTGSRFTWTWLTLPGKWAMPPEPNLYLRAAVWRFDNVDRQGKVTQPSSGNASVESAPRWLAQHGVPLIAEKPITNNASPFQITNCDIFRAPGRTVGTPPGTSFHSRRKYPSPRCCVVLEITGRNSAQS